jgi:hypothetical protein
MAVGNPQDIAAGSTSTSNVDASLLNNIKSRYEGPQVNADNFQLSDVTPEQQAEFDKASYMERNPATGPLSLTDYYPDANNPVGVGSYSGSMIGSTTLFAPGGGLVPLGMMDARDKAIQDAAYSKAKEYDAFRKMYQAPTTKLVNIQPEISSEYNKMLQGYTQEAKQKYGSQWAKKLETDQNFLAKNKSFQDLAKYGDAIVDAKAKLDDAKKTGKYTVTPSLLETERKLMSATNPDSPEFKKLGDYYRSFNMDLDFNDVFNETVKQIAMQQDAKAGADTSDPEYIRTFDSTTKYYNEESKKAAIESMKAQFPQSDYFTPEYIEKNVMARMSAVQEDKKAGATQKREANGGADFKYEDNDIEKESAIDNVEYQLSKSAGDLQEEQMPSYAGVTFKKPIKTGMTPGTQVFYPSGSNKGMISKTEAKGNDEIILTKTKVLETIVNPGEIDDGRPVTAQWKKRNPNAKTKFDVFAEGYREEGEGPKKKQIPFYVPASTVENALVKKRDANGKVILGVPIDKQRAKAEEFNKNGAPDEYDVKPIGTEKGVNQKYQAVKKVKESSNYSSAKKDYMSKYGIKSEAELTKEDKDYLDKFR